MEFDEARFPVQVTLAFRSEEERDEFMGQLSDGWGENYVNLAWAGKFKQCEPEKRQPPNRWPGGGAVHDLETVTVPARVSPRKRAVRFCVELAGEGRDLLEHHRRMREMFPEAFEE